MKIKAYGKVNIALDVTRKREDGYHLLSMVMQTINIYDELTFKKVEKGIHITSNKDFVPTDNKNLVYRAIDLFCNNYGVKKEIEVHIEKNIPVAAGMAGGSTDAAAALRVMRDIYRPDIGNDDLRLLGVKLGADVPYCIEGGTALCEGIGEVIKPLKSFKDKLLVVVKPNFSVSTVETYKKFNINEVREHPNVENIIEAMSRDDVEYVANNMMNLLELVTIKEHKEIKDIKDFMRDEGALGAMMSGSGPTVFGFFNDINKANKCSDKLKDKYKEVFVTTTI